MIQNDVQIYQEITIPVDLSEIQRPHQQHRQVGKLWEQMP